MFRFCLPSLLLFLTLAPALAGHTPTKIFLAIYVQTTGEGQPESQAHSIQVPPDGQTILVRSLPEITQRDLVDVQEDAAGSVHFRFDHDGQVALSAATGSNDGRILVLTINGYVFYAPLIDEQITDGELVMPHHLDARILKLLQDEAQENVKQASRR